VFEGAVKEAKRVSSQRCADCEHLLLALAAGDGVAGEILSERDAGEEPIREALARLLEREARGEAARSEAAARPPALARMSDERVQDLILSCTSWTCSARSVSTVGFDLKDTYKHKEDLDWAALASREAQLMLARESAPIERDKQAVLFYLCADDFDGRRDRRAAHARASLQTCGGLPRILPSGAAGL
jgi:hypothetical protein